MLGRGLHKPCSQTAQVFRLSGFVLNSVFRTSLKLQRNHNQKGRIDLLLHQSCTQTIVSYKDALMQSIQHGGNLVKMLICRQGKIELYFNLPFSRCH